MFVEVERCLIIAHFGERCFETDNKAHKQVTYTREIFISANGTSGLRGR